MLLGDKLFELPRTDRPVRRTYFSSSSLRTQGPVATGLRRFDEWSLQPAQITSAGSYRSLRSQGRRGGLRMMAVPPNHIMH